MTMCAEAMPARARLSIAEKSIATVRVYGGCGIKAVITGCVSQSDSVAGIVKGP